MPLVVVRGGGGIAAVAGVCRRARALPFRILFGHGNGIAGYFVPIMPVAILGTKYLSGLFSCP